MKIPFTFTLLLGLTLPGWTSAAAAQGSDPPAQVDFAAQIAPLLRERCLSCHNANLAKGGFDLSSRGSLLRGGRNGANVVPGDLNSSWLLDQVVPESDGSPPAMPQQGQPLAAAEVQLLRQWIAAGAPWPEQITLGEKSRADRSWWSLQPVVRREPPAVSQLPPAWQAGTIDRWVGARLIAAHLEPSEPADRRTLIRRATYDLWGLPPAPEEVEAFVTDDRPEAYAELIDRLLASPRYGEQWGRHWLDVVRFGESNGFERNVIIDSAWPFRDYVIRAWNEDRPFDRQILEHLAGDVVGQGDPQIELATAFLVVGPYDNVGNKDEVQAQIIRANTLDDMITATGSAFLGMTINCCRCHDHKFDPIPQADYYRLQATFAGVFHGERDLATPQQQQQAAEHRRILEARRAELVARQSAVTAQNPTSAELPQLQQQLAALEVQLKQKPNGSRIWAGNFRTPPANSYVMLGGDPTRHGPEVRPGSLSFLETTAGRYEVAPAAAEPQRRLALARWIAAPKNPLTWRVLANRIWQHHFGTGLVDTPSDFGWLGGRPSHPELLDYLAARLVESGFRLKPLHREILLSQTYRQASTFRPQAAAVDAQSRWLWRFPPRRLSAEELRDTLLAVSGKLNLTMGGPGFRLYQYQQDNVATYVPLDVHGPETFRRAVYHQNARASRIDLLSDFDCPDNALSAPTRGATTSPLQSLTLLNHRFTLDMAEALAQRAREAEQAPSAPGSGSLPSGDDLTGPVRQAFRLALGRLPSEEELRPAVQLAASYGLAAVCRALLNASELMYLD